MWSVMGVTSKNLEKGIELGVLDSFESSIADAVKDADMIVVAVPLGAMKTVFDQLKGNIGENSVITDAGSAKGSVVKIAAARVR